MESVLLTALLFDLIQFGVAGAGVWYSLRGLDRAAKIKFSDTYEIIRTDPFALSVYHGLRILAACLLFGAIVG